MPHAHYRYRQAGDHCDVVIAPRGSSAYHVVVSGRTVMVMVERWDETSATLRVNGRRIAAGYCAVPPGLLNLGLDSRTLTFRNELAFPNLVDAKVSGGRVTAVMHGVLVEVFVQTGDRVDKGSRLAILEAMKMQHELLSDVAGEVITVAAPAGAQVAADDLLIEIQVDGHA